MATQELTGVVEVVLPTLPFSKLGPNARLGWYGRNSLMQAAKDGMTLELRSQDCVQDPLWERAHLDITFCAGDKRRRDLDNLIACCKPWIDAMVGEVIVDDSADRLSIAASYQVGEEEQTLFRIERV